MKPPYHSFKRVSLPSVETPLGMLDHTNNRIAGYPMPAVQAMLPQRFNYSGWQHVMLWVEGTPNHHFILFDKNTYL